MKKFDFNLQLFADCQCEEEDCSSSCESSCQSTCEKSCQTSCERSCQSACEDSCMSTCELYCESTCQNSCQTTCESSCQSTCEKSCQTSCERSCQSACEDSCMSTCELYCETTCQNSCQTTCESSCQTTCQISCQTTCERDCQIGCQITCENCMGTACQTCQCSGQNNQSTGGESKFSISSVTYESFKVYIYNLQYAANLYEGFKIIVNNALTGSNITTITFQSTNTSNSTSKTISGLSAETTYNVSVSAKWNGVWYTVDVSNPSKSVTTLEQPSNGQYNPDDYIETANSSIVLPVEQWKPAKPRYIIKNAGTWHPEAYNTIIDQFNVEVSQRYKPVGGNTYCNIFSWDVTSAMGREIPHWVHKETQAPLQYGSTEFNTLYSQGKTEELSANKTYDWLLNYGQQYSWQEVSKDSIQSYADQGIPSIAIWKNPTGGSGHVVVVRPFNPDEPEHSSGIYIAQAGSNLYNYKPITSAFSSTKLPDVKYFISE